MRKTEEEQKHIQLRQEKHNQDEKNKTTRVKCLTQEHNSMNPVNA